jgi:hypothetical protein
MATLFHNTTNIGEGITFTENWQGATSYNMETTVDEIRWLEDIKRLSTT